MMHERSHPVAADKQALIDLQNEWMDAWRRLDVARLEEILAPEFTLTSARTDRLVSRSEWLELLPTVRNESFTYTDVAIDLFGDAAVVRSRLAQQAVVGDQRWDATFALTDVWIRRDGRWQVVARHSSTPPGRSFIE